MIDRFITRESEGLRQNARKNGIVRLFIYFIRYTIFSIVVEPCLFHQRQLFVRQVTSQPSRLRPRDQVNPKKAIKIGEIRINTFKSFRVAISNSFNVESDEPVTMSRESAENERE